MTPVRKLARVVGAMDLVYTVSITLHGARKEKGYGRLYCSAITSRYARNMVGTP